LATPFGQKQILDNLVEQEILYQAAKKEGLDHNKVVQAKIDLYKKVIMAQAFVENGMEKQAKEYYNTHQKEFEKLRLSDIVIRYASPEEIRAAKKAKNANAPKHTEQEALKLANEVYDKIKGGETFADAAKQYSEDPQGKETGGDLGFVSKEDPKMTRRGLSPLLEKAFSMKVGEVAGPIKTANGYHIITVTQPAEQAPFEDVKMQVLFKIRGDAKGKILANLKEKSKVVYAEELKPQEAPAPQEHDHPHGEGDGHQH
ncbi:MAG: peptidylprolyl isomerase, partial [bacterium]|nr:peptidylprolyl isomerase [bacterium]